MDLRVGRVAAVGRNYGSAKLMADYTGEDWKAAATTTTASKWVNASSEGGTYSIDDWKSTATAKWLNKTFAGFGGDGDIWYGAIVYYKMRGMSASVAGSYDTWIVSGQPDWSATRYTGALATPLRDVCVIGVYLVR